MGFKPSSAVKKYFHVRPAQFIYPDETVSCCVYNIDKRTIIIFVC